MTRRQLRAPARAGAPTPPGTVRSIDASFAAAASDPAKLRTLDDLRRLPFTTKDELKDNQAAHPPWGDVLAVPLAEVLRVHLTSATTGRPLAFLDTAADWYGFYHSYARSLHAFGVRKTDMVMAAFSYGPWIGYWSGFYAAQDLGCLVYPVGGLSTEQRLDALLTYPDHRARLHAVVRAVPGRARRPEGHRPRQGHQAADHLAYRRARRVHPGH